MRGSKKARFELLGVERGVAEICAHALDVVAQLVEVDIQCCAQVAGETSNVAVEGSHDRLPRRRTVLIQPTSAGIEQLGHELIEGVRIAVAVQHTVGVRRGQAAVTTGARSGSPTSAR